MYREDFDRANAQERGAEDVFSKPIRAGKRTYFFDVKATKGNNDYYLTITESKRRQERDGSFTFDKHKIFLYKEDFSKFIDGLSKAIGYIHANQTNASVPEPEAQENADEEAADSLDDMKIDF